MRDRFVAYCHCGICHGCWSTGPSGSGAGALMGTSGSGTGCAILVMSRGGTDTSFAGSAGSGAASDEVGAAAAAAAGWNKALPASAAEEVRRILRCVANRLISVTA